MIFKIYIVTIFLFISIFITASTKVVNIMKGIDPNIDQKKKKYKKNILADHIIVALQILIMSAIPIVNVLLTVYMIFDFDDFTNRTALKSLNNIQDKIEPENQGTQV